MLWAGGLTDIDGSLPANDLWGQGVKFIDVLRVVEGRAVWGDQGNEIKGRPRH